MGKSSIKTSDFDWWGLIKRSSKYWIPVVMKLGQITYKKIKELLRKKKDTPVNNNK